MSTAKKKKKKKKKEISAHADSHKQRTTHKVGAG
jgi:hypothetical protein